MSNDDIGFELDTEQKIQLVNQKKTQLAAQREEARINLELLDMEDVPESALGTARAQFAKTIETTTKMIDHLATREKSLRGEKMDRDFDNAKKALPESIKTAAKRNGSTKGRSVKPKEHLASVPDPV